MGAPAPSRRPAAGRPAEREPRRGRHDLRRRVPAAPQGRPLRPRAVARLPRTARAWRTGRSGSWARTSISPSASAPKRSAPAPSSCRGSCSPRKTNDVASPARCTISSASSSRRCRIGSLRSRTPAATPRISPRSVRALERVAERIDRDVDHLVWELRPTALDDLGLQAALANYLRDWSARVNIAAELHSSGLDRAARVGDRNDAVSHRAGSHDQRRQARAGVTRGRHPAASAGLGHAGRRGRWRGVRSCRHHERAARLWPARDAGARKPRRRHYSDRVRARPGNHDPGAHRCRADGRTSMVEHKGAHQDSAGGRPCDRASRAEAAHRQPARHDGRCRGERRRRRRGAGRRRSNPTSS